MDLSQIRRDADHRLQEDTGSFSKLVLIHTAIAIGMSLLLMLVNWLSSYITPGGGLSNMDTQNLLSTGQVLLQLLIVIATPFWEAGLSFCALQLLRSRQCNTNLTEGFRRWGPIAASLLIRGLIYFGVAVGCYFLCTIIVSFLPLPSWIMEDLASFIATPTLPLNSGVRTFMAICALIYIVTLCIWLVPKLYMHRLVIYRIMDDKPCGGLQAVLHSRILMKGHRKELFLLDLSFWWFYLLELGIFILSAGNLLLSAMGIALPLSDAVAAWVFPLIALLAYLALHWLAKPKLEITYALFYRDIYEKGLKEASAYQLNQPPQQD